MITTPEEVSQAKALITRVYPVRDLALVGIATDNNWDFESLIEAIKQTIAPEMWDDAGGSGSMEKVDTAGSLIVSQSVVTHCQIERLLAALRASARRQGIRIPEALAETTEPSNSSFAEVSESPVLKLPAARQGTPAGRAWRVPRLHQ